MIRNIKVLAVLCSLCISSLPISAQKEANWWFFGNKAGLNFNLPQSATATGGTVVSNLPKAVPGHFVTNEGCFTISDGNGNLMMSGDGSTIWNKNGAIMPNATSLGGGSSATQSGIIVPLPGSTTQYYSVSVAQEKGASGIQYAIVDMTMNNNLGGIVSKNNKLLSGPTDENIAAVRKTGTQNWWLIHRTQNASTNVTMTVWEATPTGITLHDTQVADLSIPYSISYLGVTKFSPDGTKFISPNYGGHSIIFGEFNPKTGILSNIDFVNVGGEVYGAEFSPNGNYVYYCPSGAPTAAAKYARQVSWSSLKAKTLAGVANLPYNLSNYQLSPDGRIYAIANGTKHLYVILNPNEPFETLEMYQIPNYLTSNAVFGLPTFASSFFSGEAEEKPFVCRGNDFRYKVEISFTGSTIDFPVKLVWDWGDGTPSETQNITSTTQNKYTLPHSYATPGTYAVTVTPYKAGNVPLTPIPLEAKVVNCQLHVNRMIRINVDNASTQLVKH